VKALGQAVLVVLALAAPASAGGGASLSAYLGQIDHARQPYVKAGASLDTALNSLHSTPDATWKSAAQKVTASQHAAEKLAAAVAAVAVPAGLEQANGQLRQAAAVAAADLKALAAGLNAKSVAKVQAAFNLLSQARTKVNALNTSWKNAVTAAAHKAGVAVPSWVATLGSS